MRFIQDHLYSLFATMAVTAALICWFAAAEPTAAKTPALRAQPWSLPKIGERDNNKAIESINARSLWGAMAAASAPKEPVWTVLGIARSGAERFILLAYAGKPIEILKVGDSLPDGVKIVEIEKDRFFVMTADKKKLAFGIYKNEPSK